MRQDEIDAEAARALADADAAAALDPEEAGIMLDRIAIEIVNAQAKNPRAVPGLQGEAQQLLAWVRVWLRERHGAAAAFTVAPQNVRGGPLALASALRNVADRLLIMAERAEADGGA